MEEPDQLQAALFDQAAQTHICSKIKYILNTFIIINTCIIIS